MNGSISAGAANDIMPLGVRMRLSRSNRFAAASAARKADALISIGNPTATM